MWREEHDKNHNYGLINKFQCFAITQDVLQNDIPWKDLLILKRSQLGKMLLKAFCTAYQKILHLFILGKDGSESVARGCLPKLGDGVCGAVAKTLGAFSSLEGQIEDINCYTCDGDKCNSATRYAGLTVFGMILAAIAFLF